MISLRQHFLLFPQGVAGRVGKQRLTQSPQSLGHLLFPGVPVSFSSSEQGQGHAQVVRRVRPFRPSSQPRLCSLSRTPAQKALCRAKMLESSLTAETSVCIPADARGWWL